jgi:hypothetical protein
MQTSTETAATQFIPDLAREPEELSLEQLEQAQGGIFLFVAGFAAGVAVGVAIGRALS